MRPLALAEFWWGQSPKSDTWKHGEFYPCCKEKCAPILRHMLS
ncbi:MAG: pseudouridylate synthase, partial [Pedobacter sp.]